MEWERHRTGWPNAQHSRFVTVTPHRWHVQEAGQGDTLLLIHGAGGATQSWRGLFPLLAETHHVVAIDLPGQGFTKLGSRMRCGLAPMAQDVARLCEAEGWAPRLIIGHSAGAALALQLVDVLKPEGIVGINAALDTFQGVAGWLFPLMAKFMALNPAIPPLFAFFAGGSSRVADLLASTGSDIGPEGVALYRRLMTDSGHVDGTLAMMSQWHIDPLLRRLERIETPVRLIVGENDGTVPPEVSHRAAARLPLGELVSVPGVGHLLHEEDPGRVRREVETFLHSLAPQSHQRA
ncbi:MAG: alpha/beta fold hydrolase BchO [Pseudomonadota bacterium]